MCRNYSVTDLLKYRKWKDTFENMLDFENKQIKFEKRVIQENDKRKYMTEKNDDQKGM